MVPEFAYHASHEQFAPSSLLRYLKMAEQAGFTGGMSSDHFHPWSREQGQSGFAWSWLGAALEGTSLSMGVVNAPGQRYHPAIIAQAAATLAEMYPDRFWLAMGSGQALNEKITGDRWPHKSERNARLKECVEIIRALWSGETVNHRGLVTIEEATLYTRPEKPPKIIGAAITAKTAYWAGKWADGLITISQPREKLKSIVQAFWEGGGEGKPMILKVQLSIAQDEEKALQGALREWRVNVFDSQVLTDLSTPEKLEMMAKYVRPEDIREMVRISADPQRHIEWLCADRDMGFDTLVLHNVNREQEFFIEQFGENVLPQLGRSGEGV